MSRTTTKARKADKRAGASADEAATKAAAALTAANAAVAAAQVAAGLRLQGARDWAEPKVKHANDYAGPKVKQAAEWAEPRVKHAADATVAYAGPKLKHAGDVTAAYAAPKVEAAAGRIAPVVDGARDTIVEGWLPKVVDTVGTAAAAATAAKAAAGERGAGAVQVLKGEAVVKKAPKRGKGRAVLVVLGVLAAVGAAVAVLLRRQDDSTDPWAQPYPTYPPAPVAPTSTPSTPVATPSGDDAGTPAEGDDEQRPETDIADISPGQHSVTDDGAGEHRA